MYKPAVTQIHSVSKFTANKSLGFSLFSHSLLSTAFLPTLSCMALPAPTPTHSPCFLLSAGALPIFSLCTHHLSFLLPFSSFLFPPSSFFNFLSPSLYLLISFFLSLIMILVLRCPKFYNTEWHGWIGWLVCHSLQTTEILKLPRHTWHILQTHGKSSIVLSFAFCSCFISCLQINSILLTDS